MTKENIEDLETLQKILAMSIEKKASDIHLHSGDYPFLRIIGDIQRVKEFGILSKDNISSALSQILPRTSRDDFMNNMQADFSFNDNKGNRYRVNAFREISGISVVFRHIDSKIRTMEELKLPNVVQKFSKLEKGLVVISGPTGSGKSTTLSSIINDINSTQKKHIITIEDPVEYIYKNKESLINQREVGKNTNSFASALKSALREDPDILLIGEMRDAETVKMALTAAETGHLVFATLHTMSAAKTIDRIIDACPADEKGMIRSMLSTSLQAVVLQTLLKRKDNLGRIAAFEVLLSTSAVKNMIRDDKVHQIPSVIETGSKYGMVKMSDYAQNLFDNSLISQEELNTIISKIDNES